MSTSVTYELMQAKNSCAASHISQFLHLESQNLIASPSLIEPTASESVYDSSLVYYYYLIFKDMGFENARDSFNDLREMRRRSTAQTTNKNNNNNKNGGGEKRTSFLFRKKADVGGSGGLSGASDSLNDLRRINYRKGGSSPTPGWNYGYEPRVDDSENGEDHWPIYELTASGERRENGNASAATVSPGASSSNGGTIAAPPIIDCERICTVPEVFDELRCTRTLQQLSSLVLRDVEPPHSSSALEPCQHFLNCLTPPWKQQHGKSCHRNDAFIESKSSSQEKVNPIRRTSIAVELYSGMPPSIRRSFAPSMFKVRLNEGVTTHENATHESSSEQTASLVGYDHRYVYSLGRDSIHNTGTTASSSPAPSIDKRNYRVHFSEIKRVLKVRKFTRNEALDVWFQRDDFDHFKAEMTLLIQEVEASRELAEVWLDAKSSSVASEASEYKNHGGDGTGDISGDGNSPTSAQHSGDTRENGHHQQRFNSRGKARAWWHNYDHSRRGLERYASPGHARQILASYKVAVQKVLGEQRWQRILGFCCIPNAYDPEKIAEVYHEYTAWSRDLALAAGASDADAVSTNFDDDKRHTREYYVLKQVIASGYKVHKHMPQFMLPRCITPTGYLNEAAILYRDNGKDATPARRSSWQLLRRTSSTGEEAREHMSRVQKSDLMGPLSPSLAPSLQQIKEAEKDVHSSMGKNGVHHHSNSMAEKAKNFPFQQ